MSYAIEIKPANKAGWHTPAEARAYYGRYARDGVTVHWWNSPNLVKDSDHDNIVNYILAGAARGEKSVNYVLSNNKITLLVGPDNVAWASQGGNPTTISVEFSPHLNDEGYKKAGWLVNELEERYGKTLNLYPHNYWFTTSCPGHLSLDRIRQEAVRWKNGVYDPTPPPTPTPIPPTVNIEWVKLPEPITYVTNKQPTKLWDFNQSNWQGFGNGVKDFNQGEKVVIYGQGRNHTLGATYMVTEYSFGKKITNGFNPRDLDVFVPPAPAPTPPIPEPEPTPPTPPSEPEWVTNLRDIQDTRYWVKEDTELIDIKTGEPTGTKSFKKDDEFVGSALTIVEGQEYRITEYSYSKRIFHGLPVDVITLTPPGEPDIPPVPEDPDDPGTVDKNIVIVFLESIVKLIQDFLGKLKGK